MRVLINRSDAIGDTILTMSMAKKIKEQYPNAQVHFIISNRSIDLFDHHPDVDSFKVYHRKARFYLKLREVISFFREIKPTHYFYVGGGYLPNFMSWLYRIPFRGGLKSRWHTYLFLNHGVRQKRSMVNMHEMEFNLNLLAPLGLKYHHQDFDKYLPEINLLPDEINEAFESFKEDLKKVNRPTDRKIIFVHPGMTGHTLNWSPRNYGRFITKMNQKFPGKFLYVVSYTPSDERYVSGLKEILNRDENKNLDNVYFFNGAINGLRNYMCILKKASLFLGPSTGTLHIAAVLNVPTVGIYSPIKVQSAMRWGPVSSNKDKIKIIVPDVICGEAKTCAQKECPYFECMGKIEVEDVIKQAISIMDV